MATNDSASVILLHGFMSTGASWDRVQIEAAAGGLTGDRLTLAPDLPGHGRSADTTQISLESIVAAISDLAGERFVLAGYSMGGRIALHVALALSSRLDRLILIGASPGIADPSERQTRRAADERFASEIENLTIARAAELWEGRTRGLFADQSAEVRMLARADRMRNESVGLARALRALGAGSLPPVWDRLHELPMPVVLSVGARDHKFRGIAEAMAVQISDCRLEVIPGTSHAAHLEAPRIIAMTIFGAA